MIPQNQIFLIISIIFSLNYNSIHAQNEHTKNYQIQHISVEDGLSQGSSYSILKDAYDFVWMTSYEGLNRYDGNEIIVYKENPLDSTSIEGNNTNGLVEDGRGNIWTGSEKCLNQLVRSTNTFKKFYCIDSLGKKQNTVHYPIFADSTFLWFMNEVKGLARLHLQELTKEIIDKNIKYEKNNFLVNSALTFDGSQIWIRRKIGVSVLDTKSLQVHNIFTDTKDGRLFQDLAFDSEGNGFLIERNELTIISKDLKRIEHHKIPIDQNIKVLSLSIINPNLFWFGTSAHGLLLVDLQEGIINSLSKDGEGKQMLPTNTISNLYVDSNDNLWATADPHGACLVTEQEKEIEKYVNFEFNNRSISSGGIRCFYETEDGDVLIGTEDEGIFIFDTTTWEFKSKYLEHLYPQKQISLIHIDAEENVWLGSYNGLYRINPSTKEVININQTGPFNYLEDVDVIWGIVEDKVGNIYYSTDAGIFVWNAKIEQIFELPIFQRSVTGNMFVDSENYLFVSGHLNGFATIHLDSIWETPTKLNGRMRFHHHYQNEINVKSYLECKFDSLYYLATTTGLYVMTANHEHTSFKIVDFLGSEAGLPSVYTYGALEDEYGNIWCSSNRGIFKYDPKNKEVSPIHQREGLQGYEYNTNAFFKSSNGILYFGGVNGFNRFDPNKIKYSSKQLPQPLIISISSNDRVAYVYVNSHESKTVEFEPDQNDLRINFSIPTINREDDVSLEYILSPYQNDWIEAKSKDIAIFQNISSGSYDFLLREKMKKGNSGSETIVNVIIKTPWYETILAKLIFLFLGMLVLYYLISLFIKRRLTLEKNIQLVKLDKLKNKIFNQVSHDFKTPLSIIKSAASRIGNNNAEKIMIQNSAEELIEMVNQILNINKLKLDDIELNYVQSDINEYLEKILSPFIDLANDADKTFEFIIQNESIFMDFDQEHLKRILYNLIDNCLKYTNVGDRIQVTVCKSKESQLQIDVKDTGIGIDEKIKDKVYDYYFTQDEDTGKSQGIGLNYVEHIVDLMGGNLSFNSEVNVGTHFKIEIPIYNNYPIIELSDNVYSQQIKRQEKLFFHQSIAKDQTILIVEDNSDLRSLLNSIISNQYNTITAENGKEAINQIKKFHPDFVLTDIMMPEMDGFQLCKILKSTDEYNHIPVVMLTAKSDIESRKKAIQLGAEGYINKPFDNAEVLLKIENLIQLRKILQKKYQDSFLLNLEKDDLDKKQIDYLIRINNFLKVNIEQEKLSVQDLTKELTTNHVTLNKKIKALTGLTTAAYIRKFRMQMSYNLITKTDLPIAQIITKIGIPNASQFSKLFKSEFETTPSALRKKTK